MDTGRAGNHGLRHRKIISAPVHIGDSRACLFADQAASSDIPGIESKFPKAVKTTCSYIAEIERRGPKPADALRKLPKFHKVGKIILRGIPGIVGETRHE